MYINKNDFSTRNTDKSEYFECDDLIAPAIILLNKKGYKTTFCCGGHAKKIKCEDNNIVANDNYGIGFYIVFKDNYEFYNLPEPLIMCKDVKGNSIIRDNFVSTCGIYEYKDVFDIYSNIYTLNKTLYEWVKTLPDLTKDENSTFTQRFIEGIISSVQDPATIKKYHRIAKVQEGGIIDKSEPSFKFITEPIYVNHTNISFSADTPSGELFKNLCETRELNDKVRNAYLDHIIKECTDKMDEEILGISPTPSYPEIHELTPNPSHPEPIVAVYTNMDTAELFHNICKLKENNPAEYIKLKKQIINRDYGKNNKGESQ